jgi:hypothetical protein
MLKSAALFKENSVNKESELEFVSTTELLNEIINRKTFAGVVIYSKNEHCQDGQIHNDFNVLTTCSVPTTAELLNKVITELQEKQ